MIESLTIYFIVAFILLHTPIVGKYVAVIHTLIHEIGHTLATIITGGRVQSIKLFANTEGEAWSRNTRFGQTLTTLAGYPFASVTSVFLLYHLSEQNYTVIIMTLSLIALISVIFWIRNIYGILWVTSFLYLGYQTLTATTTTYIEPILTLLVCIIYIEAVQKALTVFILSIKKPKYAGDATLLRQTTHIIPTSIWGLFFLIQALINAIYGIYHYIL